MAVKEGEHLDGLIGDEETDDRRLQQVFVVFLHRGDRRLVVIRHLRVQNHPCDYHEAVRRGMDDRFQREDVGMVGLDRGFEVFRQLSSIDSMQNYVDRQVGWIHNRRCGAVDDHRVFLFEIRDFGKRVENGEKFNERFRGNLRHGSSHRVLLVEYFIIL